MESVGIRELRQNLSVYVEKVKTGQRFIVTERGKPVAELVPLPQGETVWDRLVAEGKVTPAKGDGSTLLSRPLKAPPGAPLASEVLQQMRDEETF